MAMKRLLSLLLFPFCLFFSLNVNASAKDSKSGIRESLVVIGQVKPLAIDSVKVSVLNATKDLWDKSLVVGTSLAAIAGIGAAFFTGKAAFATKEAAEATKEAVKATEKSIDQLKRQLELQRLDALVRLGNYYQESHDRTTKNMTDIMNALRIAPQSLDKGFQAFYEKYFSEDALGKTQNRLQELRAKSDSIDKEIEEYYDKLI